jgi:hypothetical protein
MNADAAVTDKPSTLPWPMQLAVPVASLITFGTHWLIAQKAPPLETHSYMLLFWEIVGVSIVLAIVQHFWPALRKWMRHMWPFYGRHPVTRRLGRDYGRLALAPAAIFSRTCGGLAQLD